MIAGFRCQFGDGGIERCYECKDRCYPLPIILALWSQRETEEDVFHVTEVLSPPMQVFLQRTEDYYVTPESMADVALGTAWHSHIEKSEGVIQHHLGDEWADVSPHSGVDLGHIFEQSFCVEIGDKTLTGTYDYYDVENKTLWDWKTLKKRGYEKMARNDWDNTYKEQINIYRVYGCPEAEHMKIGGLLKDWGPAVGRQGIPKLPIIDVPKMPDGVVEAMVEGLIEEHSSNLITGSPRPCTTKEKWGGVRCTNYCWVNYLCPDFNDVPNGMPF